MSCVMVCRLRVCSGFGGLMALFMLMVIMWGGLNCEFFVGPGTHLVQVGMDSEFIFFFWGVLVSELALRVC
jgi:hypothetical protein